jgi:hypothetical protein
LLPVYLLEATLFMFLRIPAIHPKPIFIIGHWRSGTTYLHNLLANDPQFGYCSNLDAFVPGALVVGRWLSKKVLGHRLPRQRPVDDVTMYPESPQEEEFAMMLLSQYSLYHYCVFPQTARPGFNSPLSVHDPVAWTQAWMRRYEQFLQRISFRNHGKPLILKNPANTLRIRSLLSLFPHARFIYLSRDEEAVCASARKMFRAFVEVNTLQNYDNDQLDNDVEALYRHTIGTYRAQRSAINPAHLIEVDYDDLVASPINTIRRIYRTFNLDGFVTLTPILEAFVARQPARRLPDEHPT